MDALVQLTAARVRKRVIFMSHNAASVSTLGWLHPLLNLLVGEHCTHRKQVVHSWYLCCEINQVSCDTVFARGQKSVAFFHLLLLCFVLAPHSLLVQIYASAENKRTPFGLSASLCLHIVSHASLLGFPLSEGTHPS